MVDLVFNRWKLTDPQSYRGWAAELVGIILSWMILPSPSNKPPESRNSELNPSFLPSLGLGEKEDPNFAPSLFSRFKEIVGIYRDKSGCQSIVLAVSSGAVSLENWWNGWAGAAFLGLGFVPGQECLGSMVTRWWFQKIFYFQPLVGEMIQFDEHIFQMGWNHQLGQDQWSHNLFFIWRIIGVKKTHWS